MWRGSSARPIATPRWALALRRPRRASSHVRRRRRQRLAALGGGRSRARLASVGRAFGRARPFVSRSSRAPVLERDLAQRVVPRLDVRIRPSLPLAVAATRGGASGGGAELPPGRGGLLRAVGAAKAARPASRDGTRTSRSVSSPPSFGQTTCCLTARCVGDDGGRRADLFGGECPTITVRCAVEEIVSGPRAPAASNERFEASAVSVKGSVWRSITSSCATSISGALSSATLTSGMLDRGSPAGTSDSSISAMV